MVIDFLKIDDKFSILPKLVLLTAKLVITVLMLGEEFTINSRILNLSLILKKKSIVCQ